MSPSAPPMAPSRSATPRRDRWPCASTRRSASLTARGKDKRTGTGNLVNAANDRDIAVWGKRAVWCDASGPLADGRVIGIALLEHPQNFRHPTWWHARDYGRLSANPFGQHDFEKLKYQPTAGDHLIPAGGSLTLRYRLVFHRGDTAAADIPAGFRAYAAEM